MVADPELRSPELYPPYSSKLAHDDDRGLSRMR
jgi:hypothetical protein